MAGLADPFTLGRLSLRNRLVATAHGPVLVRAGRALPGEADYWRRCAEGGVAMAIIGGTCVDARSQDRHGVLLEAFRDEAIPDLAARADAIKSGGAVAVQQILHLGRETLGAPTWYAPVAPSAVRSPREPVAPRPLTIDEVEAVVEAFAHASANVAAAGFDGVELHAAHGYLLSQFLSPVANARTDRYGGDRSGRVRLLTETVAAIRALETGLAIGVRLSVEPGLDVDELAGVVAELDATAPVDYVNVTFGPRGEYVRDMGTEEPPLLGAFAPLRGATSSPLVVASAFRTRTEIDEALAQGADLVGIARPLIADADFPRKLVEGRDAEIRPCVNCNEDCRLFTPSLLCSVNPDLAPPGERRRRAQPLLVQAATSRERGVVILGAGPAGLECATTLAGASRDDVVLLDTGGVLGGALATAAKAPHRRGWQRILDYWSAGLESGGVDVRLGSAGDAAALAAAGEIVVATGSREVLPDIPGVERALGVGDFIATRPQDAERIVIVDDGFGWWPGVSALETSIAMGAETTVLTPNGALALGLPHESRTQLMPRLVGSRLQTRSFLVPVAVEPEGLAVRDRLSGESELLPADLVVFVGERRPVGANVPFPAGARVQLIGDAVVPRLASHAIAEGRAAAEAILSR